MALIPYGLPATFDKEDQATLIMYATEQIIRAGMGAAKGLVHNAVDRLR